MKSINISKSTFEKLKKLDFDATIMNTESQIYNYSFHGQNRVIKSLNIYHGEYFATKIYTIEMLNALKKFLPTNFIIPDLLVSFRNKNIGFSMPKFDGITLNEYLKSPTIEISGKIETLKRVGETLKNLDQIRTHTPATDIFLNDLHDSNIMVNPNNGQIAFIDLDSVKIGNNKVFISRFLNPFGLLKYLPEKYHYNPNTLNTNNNQFEENQYYLGFFCEGDYIPDRNTDLYCYMIMILNYISQRTITGFNMQEFYDYLSLLKDCGMPNELIDCFNSLFEKGQTINPCDNLDAITPKIICKVREKQNKIFNQVL